LEHSYPETLQAYPANCLVGVPAKPVNPCFLSFQPSASCKYLVEQEKAAKLANEILTDGFLTFEEPLKVVHVANIVDPNLAWVARAQVKSDGNDLVLGGYFCAGYAKGMSRACTFLGLAALIMMDDTSEPSLYRDALPHLFSTGGAVWVHCLNLADGVEAALYNAKVSQRGSIRKSNNVITWAGVIARLRCNGEARDPGLLLRRWNQMSGVERENQILGLGRTLIEFYL